ncbi:hypothetical protein ACFUN8_20100 [Streptomyces sp. NPDC057307]|uniref:hypothetical protein n=1 Tax=Streptomyces sp. NPDC057307 TaxID=3346096 RepID=UPI003643FBC7
MLFTIAGLADRRSWSMLHTESDESGGLSAHCQEVSRYERRAGGLAVHEKHQQAVMRQAVKVSRCDALRCANGAIHVASCSSRVCRYVREDSPEPTVTVLQQILAEQAGRADADAQPGGHSTLVIRHLAGPTALGAENKESRGK